MMRLVPEGDESTWGQERKKGGGIRVTVALDNCERYVRGSGGLGDLAGSSEDSSG